MCALSGKVVKSQDSMHVFYENIQGYRHFAMLNAAAEFSVIITACIALSFTCRVLIASMQFHVFCSVGQVAVLDFAVDAATFDGGRYGLEFDRLIARKRHRHFAHAYGGYGR